MAEGLTARQSECLDFIAGYIADEGISPSYLEVKVALKVRSTSTVTRLVNCLADRGFLTFRSYQSRSIILTDKARNGDVDCCPTCGGNWRTLDDATRSAMLGIAARFHAKQSAAKLAAE